MAGSFLGGLSHELHQQALQKGEPAHQHEDEPQCPRQAEQRQAEQHDTLVEMAAQLQVRVQLSHPSGQTSVAMLVLK